MGTKFDVDNSGDVTAVGTLTTGSSGQFHVSAAGVTTAPSFVGSLTGNASGSAATVTAAAQPAITSLGVQTAALNMGGFQINNVANPTSAQDSTTKAYVDAIASGLTFHASVALASTTAIPAYTYNNGAAGVGATITSNAFGNLVLDGVATTTGMRVLIKNEVGGNAPYNGIYDVTAAGSVSTDFVLTRSSDADTPAELAAGAAVFIDIGGTTQATTIWTQITSGTIIIGTTNLLYVEVAAPTQYTAGTGLTLIGTQFSLATPVSIANGGTGLSTTSQSFAFIGPTSGSGAPTWRLLVPSDVPTLNQNTTGTASNVTGIVALLNGGTGNTTGTATINANLTGDVTSVGNATHLVALGTTGASVNVNASAPPTAGKVLTATSATTATWQASVPASITTQSVVTGSRALNTVYQNTGTKPLFVCASITVQTGAADAITDSSPTPTTVVGTTFMGAGGNSITTMMMFIVLPGNYYEITGGNSMVIWTEWS